MSYRTVKILFNVFKLLAMKNVAGSNYQNTSKKETKFEIYMLLEICMKLFVANNMYVNLSIRIVN